LEKVKKFGLNWKDHVEIDTNIFRPSDINYSKGNPAKAFQKLGWQAQLKMPEIIKIMLDVHLNNTPFTHS